MELRIVILYSLLLGSQTIADGSVLRKWPESLVGSNEGIDPWKGISDSIQLVTLSALDEDNDAKSSTVHWDEGEGGASVHRSVSAVADGLTTTTVRGKLIERAAEILGTSDNHQPAISPSSLWPSTPETRSTTSSQLISVVSTPETTSPTSVASSLSETSSSSTTETIVSTTDSSSTISFQSSSESSQTLDDTIQPDETNATMTTTTVVTVVSTSTISPVTLSESTAQQSNGNEEYFADDAASSSSTTDATSDDDETTIVVSDKSTIVHHLEPIDQHSNTSLAINESSQSTTEASHPSVAVSSAVVAVGRALSQEESVPWPEAKSTKVIGTIIEDIHGPFSDGVSSVSTSSPDVLTSSGIAAIVMCTFLVLLTTAGASGYWWYRRRYLLNRPETLSERYAPSETGLGAGDDIFRVGYVHSPELPRDSSEEMYSLDNDSFLTSLEAMTIPTYWTETIKHTKL